MNPSLEAAMQRARAGVDARLEVLVDGGPPRLREAMRYAALAPGKRLRPILCLWTHEMLGAPRPGAALDAACGLELVHTYSLVHDDLPCMDDDALRRGRATTHVVFGEATAVLVGDALLNLGYETLLGATWDEAAIGLACARELAQAASHRGLLGGQALDLEAEGEEPSQARLDAIHAAKTGALLRAAMCIGALAAGAEPDVLSRIGHIGAEIGLAFQIADDVLDVVGEPAALGKSAGKDAGARKMTYPALYGVEQARALAAGHAEAAQRELAAFSGSENLQALALYCVQRAH